MMFQYMPLSIAEQFQYRNHQFSLSSGLGRDLTILWTYPNMLRTRTNRQLNGIRVLFSRPHAGLPR